MSDTSSTNAREAAVTPQGQRRLEQFRTARRSVDKKARVRDAKKLGYTVVGISGAGVIGR